MISVRSRVPIHARQDSSNVSAYIGLLPNDFVPFLGKTSLLLRGAHTQCLINCNHSHIQNLISGGHIKIW